MRLALIIAVGLIGTVAGFCIGYPVGRLRMAFEEIERRYEEDCASAAPVLAADPAFRRLKTARYPVLGFCLEGPVAKQDDYDRLRAEMARLFGEPRVAHIMNDVVVEEKRGRGAGALPDAGVGPPP